MFKELIRNTKASLDNVPLGKYYSVFGIFAPMIHSFLLIMGVKMNVICHDIEGYIILVVFILESTLPFVLAKLDPLHINEKYTLSETLALYFIMIYILMIEYAEIIIRRNWM